MIPFVYNSQNIYWLPKILKKISKSYINESIITFYILKTK